jgi:hypothetical protein
MTSWIIIAPTAILLLAALLIMLLQIRKPVFGLAWLIAAIFSLVSWGIMLFLRLRLPETIVLADLRANPVFTANPMLAIDRPSWPYAICLATVALAVILTEAMHPQVGTFSPTNWAGSLALIAVDLLAVMAGNPYTLMMAWTAIDLIELMILLGGSEAEKLSQRIVISFAARLMGTLFLLVAVVNMPSAAGSFELKNITPLAGFLILLAASFRLGVLPLHLPFSQEPRLRRGMGTVLRLTPAASSLVLLARLPENILPGNWVNLITALVAVGVFYTSVKWLSAPDELAGRPYWLVGMAGLAVACVINGAPLSSLAWGVALLLPGSLLFLCSARQPAFIFIPVLGLWGLLGLPFSPAASGWEGLWLSKVTLWSAVLWIDQVLLVLGYLRHASRKVEPVSTSERWAVVAFHFGLILLVLIDIIVGIWGWPGSRTTGIWWLSVSAFGLGCLAVLLYWHRGNFFKGLTLPEGRWLTTFFQVAGGFIIEVFRLDWFYRFIWSVYRVFGRIVDTTTGILEGDGGILWSLLLLAILASLISRGGT